MLVLERVFRLVTSLTLVILAIRPGHGMTVSEDQRVTSTMMAPRDDQSEPTSPMTKYTESREVQEHINSLFTYPGRPLNRARTATPPTSEVPSCATEHAYCSEQEDGITDDLSVTVDQLLGSSPGFRQQFNATDILTLDDRTLAERGPDAEKHLCGYKVELTRVTWATTEDNVVMRIAQSKNFAQAVRLEHCTKEDCRCLEIFTAGLFRPYKARCKQKFVYRTLLALTQDARKKVKLMPHSFPLPSCCSCVITKELNYTEEVTCQDEGLGERIAEDTPPQPTPPTSTAPPPGHPLPLMIVATLVWCSRLQ